MRPELVREMGGLRKAASRDRSGLGSLASRFDAFFGTQCEAFRALFRPLARWLAGRMSADPVSIARPVLSLPVLWLAFAAKAPAAALVLYTAGWSLDILDGTVAEERKRMGRAGDPRRGELIDATCDKVYLIPILIALLLAGAPSAPWRTPAAAVLILAVLSETTLLLVRLRDFRAGRPGYGSVPPGKIKIWAQALGAGCLLLAPSGGRPTVWWLGLFLLAASLPFSMLSLRSKLSRHRER